MTRRFVRLALVALVGAVTLVPAHAQYRYGGGYGTSGEPGFLLFLEGSLANPRNTDNVVATEIVGGDAPVVPVWGEDLAVRLGLGYRFQNGGKLMFSVWNYETDVDFADSGLFAFSIGPAIDTGATFIGDTGSLLNIKTEINARTVDVYWAVEHELTEAFTMEWSAGLRQASFEETSEGVYGDGSFLFDAAKSNEGEMVGARVAARGTYRFTSYSVSASYGISLLDGELDAHSSLRPTPSSFPASSARLKDDGRSGTIREFDLVGAWHSRSEKWRLYLGWEQSTWDDLAADLMRNLEGTGRPLRDRDAMTFSGYKVGVHIDF